MGNGETLLVAIFLRLISSSIDEKIRQKHDNHIRK